MKYYKFTYYSESHIKECLDNSNITANDATSNDYIENKLKKGDRLLLARYDELTKTGRVKAIGIVENNFSLGLKIKWKIKSLVIHPQGAGHSYWKKNCTGISPEPVKRYGLDSTFKEQFST